MSKIIKKHKKNMWDAEELDRYYNAAIVEGRSASYILAHSGKNRTLMSIYTKLWKEFRISRRMDSNGEIYFYLDDAPKKILKRRAKVNKSVSLGDVKYTSEISELEAYYSKLDKDIKDAQAFIEKSKEYQTIIKYKVKHLKAAVPKSLI